MPINYENSKIYKITNDINNDIYINATISKYLCDVIKIHRNKYSNTDNILNLYQSMRIIGIENFKIILLENVDCKNKDELNGKKQIWIDKLKPILNLYSCYCENCDYKFKQNSHLKRHLANVHNIGVVWFKCTEKDCNSKFKENSHLKDHLSNVHDIGVRWFKCTEKDCNSKFKVNGSLKRHLAFVHNIGVKLFICTEKDCNSKFKSKGHLQRHLSGVHDIGDKQCSFCLGNVFKLNDYIDNIGKHKICRKCYNNKTGKNSRIEHTMSDFLDKYFGTQYLLGSDKSMKSMGGCSLKRPDKLYASPELVLQIECDENGGHSSSDYSCDEKRISDLYDEFIGKKYVIIRWNPDSYKIPSNKTKIKKKEDKLILLLKLMNKYYK